MTAPPARYSSVAMALHWLIALLVVGNLAGGHLVELFEDSGTAGQATAATLVMLHMSSGVTILALTLVRISWRLGHPPPPLPGYMTVLERRWTGLVHFGFYLLLLALPLTGWAMQSTRRLPEAVPWFGLFSLPPLPLPRSLAGVFHDAHDLLGWLAVVLIGLHIGAVLKHRWFDRDDILARMLPRR
jgi:cytochrome b561